MAMQTVLLKTDGVNLFQQWELKERLHVAAGEFAEEMGLEIVARDFGGFTISAAQTREKILEEFRHRLGREFDQIMYAMGHVDSQQAGLRFIVS